MRKDFFKKAAALLICFMMLLFAVGCAPQPSNPDDGNTPPPSGGGDVTPPDDKPPVEEELLLTFGVFADTQVPALGAKVGPSLLNAAENLETGLTYFKERGIETLILNGDIIDYVNYGSGSSVAVGAAYKHMNSIMDKVWGENRIYKPLNFMYTLGNHEYYYDYSASEALRQWNLAGYEMNQTFTVNDFSFISIDMKDNGGSVSGDTKMLVEERLAAAKAVDPNRPIFLFYHIPPADTVLNTDWTTPADAWIKGLLSQYPQAVLFTAHTHFSVRHPRQIDQTIATVVNGGAGTYVCVPDTDASGRAYDNADDNVPMNGDIADDTAALGGAKGFNDSCGALVVNVYTAHVEIERVDCHTGEKIAEDWSFPYVKSASDFVYGSAYKDKLAVPQISAESCTARWNPDQPRRVQLAFAPAADTGENVVDAYRLEIYCENAKIADKNYLSDYWNNTDGNLNYDMILPKEYKGKALTIKVQAIDAFGRLSNQIEISVPAAA
ncbi:MAG: hypothetical protein DBX59_02315 [Bacillota bacterium]|nr:MAG: hypothetical protein DBX59_02315 [Bacillota bacterium]